MKQSSSRIVVILAGLLLVGSLTACGDDGDATDVDTSKETVATELRCSPPASTEPQPTR